MYLIRKLLPFVGLGTDPDEDVETNPFSVHTNEKLRAEILQRAAKITECSTNDTYRILVCGIPQQGKSSLINNILSALDGSRLVQMARSGEYEDQLTRNYLEYPVTIGKTTTTLKLCDTCGLVPNDGGTSAANVYSAIRGELRAGDPMVNDSRDASRERGPVRATTSSVGEISPSRPAVAILFVMSIGKVIENSPWFQEIIPILNYANQKGIPVACFLTKCDVHDDKVNKDITFLYRSNVVEKGRNTLHAKFQGFPLNRIFPIVNYERHLNVTPGRMLQTLYAMEHIMADIEDYLYKAKYQYRD